ncbi:hypothetical protein [Gilvimarinus agarilyticus]|uniref:hypothetical protein n=1 Tax=Gilvimarinus agarilyticus TaxID=679259 RepID=UPI000697C8EC|nr:hypothetical protein [Gilvimarinus agarilyticus]
MKKSSSRRSHESVARAIVAMDDIWIRLFRDIGLSDLSYCDLLIQMWLKRGHELHKTDLYDFMPSVSRRTAVKYVQRAIDEGHLNEKSTKLDKRVRRVELTPSTVKRLEQFFELTTDQFFGTVSDK